MNTSTLFTTEELQAVLAQLKMNQESGSLTLSNRSVVKRFNFHNSHITAWATSNKDRQFTNLGGMLLRQKLAPPEELRNAFIQHRQHHKHYCQILCEKNIITEENIRAAAHGVVCEEIAEVFTWEEGQYEISSQPFPATNIYDSQYLQNLNISVPVSQIIDKVAEYLEEWQTVLRQLNNLNLVLIMNTLLARELQELLETDISIYDGVTHENGESVLGATATQQLQKGLSLFSGKRSVKEVVELLSCDRLYFCQIVYDLIRRNYLRILGLADVMELAKQSQSLQEAQEAKKYYQLAATHPDISPDKQDEIQNLYAMLYAENASEKTKEMASEKPNVEFPGYEIMEELGKGAMGRVYKARQKSLNRFVAIKVVPPPFSNNQIYLKRLELEAKAMARLKHSNIVSAIDFGFQSEYYYIIMEYVEGGKSLRHLIEEKGHLTEQQVAEIGIAVTGALKYLDEHQLVHRDIKPGNILVDKDGTPKVADLGLIKDTEADMGLTMPGTSVGTPAYMSPEQLQAQKDIDIRSDIYSLGATMLHALTGKSRFGDTASVGVIYHKIVSQKRLRIRDLGNISDAMERILIKMLQPDRDKRYQTPAVLLEDLQQVLAGHKPQMAVVRSQQTVRLAAGLAGGLVVLLVVIFWLFSGKSPTTTALIPDKPVNNGSTTSGNSNHNGQTQPPVTKPPETSVATAKSWRPKIEALLKEAEPLQATVIIAQCLQTEKQLEPLLQAWLYYYQGVLFKKNGRITEAQQALEAAFAKIQAQEIALYLGYLAFEQGKWEETIKYAAQAQTLQAMETPVDAKGSPLFDFGPIRSHHLSLSLLYYIRGKAYWGIKDAKLALQDLTVALSMDAKLADALKSRLEVYQAQKDYPGIVQDTTALIGMLPQESNYLLERAKAFHEMGKHQEAVADLNTLLENSYRLEALLLRIEANRKLKKNDLVLEDLNLLILKEPGNTQALLERARYYEDANNIKSAVKDYQDIIKANPKEKRAAERLIHIYQKYNKLELLNNLYEKLLAAEPGNVEFQYGRARLYLEQKKYREAIGDLTAIVAKEPQFKDVYFQRGLALYHSGEFKSALADMSQAIFQNQENTDAYYWRGMLLENNQEYDLAAADFGKFLTAMPQDSKALLARARCLIKTGKYELALNDLDKITGTALGQTKVWEMKAECQIKLERYSAALQSFDDGERYGQLTAEGYYGRGDCYYKLSQLDRAIVSYQKAIARNKNFALAYLNLGACLYKKSQISEALYAISQAILLDPKNDNAYYNRGMIYLTRKEYSAAAKDFAQVIQLNRSMTDAFYYRGYSLYKLEKYDEATQDLQNFLSQESKGRNADSARAILKKIKKG